MYLDDVLQVFFAQFGGPDAFYLFLGLAVLVVVIVVLMRPFTGDV